MKTKLIFLGLVGLVIAGGVFWYFNNFELASRKDSVVATVNGFDITREELDIRVTQAMQAPNAQPTHDVNNVEQHRAFTLQVLDSLVNDTLLLVMAQDAGIVATAGAIEAQYTAITSQFPDTATFQAQLATVGLTEESLRENVRRQVVMDAYVKQVVAERGITATGAEVKQVYDTEVKIQPNAPALKDVEASIKSYIEQKKVAEIFQAEVAKLRETATIEIKI